MLNQDLYDPREVKKLFDEMAGTYGIVNLMCSFGFSWWWRQQTIAQVHFPAKARVADLMSGMGELWPSIAARAPDASILAVDISPEMSRIARRRSSQLQYAVDLRIADILTTSLEPESIDVVVSSFGLKTFNEAQLRILARQIASVLRPGGVFSLTEISVPPNRILRAFFMGYLCHLIPSIGRIFLGNPQNYRMLGQYTRRFESAKAVAESLRKAGLKVRYRSYFFGCATGVVGSKPVAS